MISITTTKIMQPKTNHSYELKNLDYYRAMRSTDFTSLLIY